ncbi:MAG: hypothetical protein JW958_06760 [Candidatus Eisenbacteria bacterium]|nr:hypothetical protein [Candidatus Eisenbacteria bacterium]
MNQQAKENPDLQMEERGAPQLTGRDVFTVLFRRKWIVLILFLSTLIFVLWNASRIPTEYRAVSKVLLNRGMRNSALDRNISLLTWDETVNSELQIAQSQPVIRRAQDLLNEQTRNGLIPPVEIDPNHVTSLLLGESNVVGIEYMSLNPEEVPAVANALVRSYIQVHKELFALPDVEQFFDTHIRDAEENLEDLTSRKQLLQEEGETVRLRTQQDNLVRRQADLRQELAEAEKEYVKAKEELEQNKKLFYEDNVEVPFESGTFEATSGRLRVLHRLKDDLLTLRRDRSELLARFTDQHPRVLILDEEIQEVQDELRRETEQIIQLKERHLEVNRAELEALRRSLNELAEEFRRFPRIEREMDNLDRSILLASEAYQKLTENRITIGVATVSSRDFTLSLLAEAGEPRASNPREPVRLALVPAFSLLMGISLAFFIETMDHSLKSREDVERHIRLPVLASIPNRRDLSKS